MTDPNRGHRLYVELLENDDYRGRLYQDDQGEVVLMLYDKPESPIPTTWLIGIITHYKYDLGMRSEG